LYIIKKICWKDVNTFKIFLLSRRAIRSECIS